MSQLLFNTSMMQYQLHLTEKAELVDTQQIISLNSSASQQTSPLLYIIVRILICARETIDWRQKFGWPIERLDEII